MVIFWTGCSLQALCLLFSFFFLLHPSSSILHFVSVTLFFVTCSLLSPAPGFILEELLDLKSEGSLREELVPFSCFYLTILIIKQADWIWRGAADPLPSGVARYQAQCHGEWAWPKLHKMRKIILRGIVPLRWAVGTPSLTERK